MLGYIRQQLESRANEAKEAQAFNAVQEEAQMTDAVLECAHLFQELDDLSMAGTEAGSDRPFTKIDIPLEDDVEITSVEVDLMSGRLTNVPGDATVQEMDDYTTMKTVDDFYQEAVATTTQFMREPDDAFSDRCREIAKEKFAAYKKYCIQEGFYGFDHIDMTDDRVPSRFIMECGQLNGNNLSAKLGIEFQTDKNDQILKKQLDSVTAFKEEGQQTIQEAVFEKFGKQVGATSAEDIWSFITPTKMIVPTDPGDHLCVTIECEIDGTSDVVYVGWSKLSRGGDAVVSEMDISAVRGLDCMQKGDALRAKAAREKTPYRRPSRFVQEAIDFGNPDEAPAADPGAPAVSFDAPPPDGAPADPNATPPVDGAAPDAAAPPVEGDPAAEAPADGTENKEIVDTNNVSDQIAEKVADETQNDANAENDVNIDGVDADLGGDEAAPTEADLNAELGDTGSEEAPMDEPPVTSDLDFDNMSMDEILAQAQEKIKGMPMDQLKEFLQNADTNVQPPIDSDVPPADGATPGVEQEAFFLTRGNINKELDIHLRKALGILNSSDMDIEQICSEFKKEGWKLNRVVHHASTMKNVFNETERKQLLKLNHCLSDLSKMLRADIDQGSIMTVKRMIQAFVSEASGVLMVVERKMGKPVQEQTVFGVGPVSDSRGYDIPIKCPDKMSRDQVLIIQALFSPAVGSDAKDSILRKIVYPYCLDNGLRQNALNKLYEYMTGEKTDNADEAELQDNFEHYEYYLEFLYPPAAGEIVSDTKAYITFDSDCSHIKNLKDTKRPAGYVQLKVEVSIDGGEFSARLVSPHQSNSFDILTLDMNDLGEWYDTSKNRSQFVTVQEGFFDRFKKKNEEPTQTPTTSKSDGVTKHDFATECYTYAYMHMPKDLRKAVENAEKTDVKPARYTYPATDYLPKFTFVLYLKDWSSHYLDDALADQKNYSGDDSWSTAIRIFRSHPFPYIVLGTVESDEYELQDATIEFSLVDQTVYLRMEYQRETEMVTLGQSWSEFKNRLTEGITQEGFFSKIGDALSGRTVSKIEKMTGSIPADLRAYLTKGYRDGYKWRGKFLSVNGKKFIITRVEKPKSVLKSGVPVDMGENMTIMSANIPLFECTDNGYIFYNFASNAYLFSNKPNDRHQLGTTFDEMTAKLSRPEDDDVEYIEVYTGRRLPSEFVEVFKSKDYQALVKAGEFELNDVNREDKDYTTDFYFAGAETVAEWTADDDTNPNDAITFGVLSNDAPLIYWQNKVWVDNTSGNPYVSLTFGEWIKSIHDQLMEQERPIEES